MKPKTIKFILVFFNIVIFSSLGWSQCDGCNFIFTYSNYWYPDQNEFMTCQNTINSTSDCNEDDIQFLNDLINQNGINEETSIYDINDDNAGLFNEALYL